MAKAKKLAFAVVALVAIGISWISNETLYGAINPVGYWKAELANTAEKDCSTFKELLARSAEEARVVGNKYQMGIATAFEVKESVESLKLFNDMHFSCATSAEKRRTEVRKRLTQLGKKY
ncbi:MAG: hypothetical protein IPK02_18165 [Candidatus Accumulibacter sp.]|uniref:Uncharacterized protein n=1 Tax=Candidatus Accumulibacter affinis TaxID=2954384 RepID=A0A935W673_9PROT|nr:hypothetical protein [Candidatus Accumulibacter affinis]